MPTDLEKFLQQAAERLAQKTAGRPQTGGTRPSPAPTSSPRSRAASPPGRPAPKAEVIAAEIIDDASLRSRTLRQAGPDPLSTIDTRPALAQSIGMADERMGDHVHQVFDHELTNLRSASASLGASQSNVATEVVSRLRDKSPLVETLRNPETLRAAFIVGEIFRRPT